jgi:hypothetical protein
VLPALYAVSALLIVVNALYRDTGPTGAGALIIATGIPLYFFFRKR